MASVTKTVSGTTATYVITDMTGALMTMAQSTALVTGPTVTFSASGAMHEDGLNAAANLLLQLATGLTPQVNGQ